MVRLTLLRCWNVTPAGFDAIPVYVVAHIPTDIVTAAPRHVVVDLLPIRTIVVPQLPKPAHPHAPRCVDVVDLCRCYRRLLLLIVTGDLIYVVVDVDCAANVAVDLLHCAVGDCYVGLVILPHLNVDLLLIRWC